MTTDTTTELTLDEAEDDDNELWDAILDLRDAYAEAVGTEKACQHPAMGCCGCGGPYMDVLTEPSPPEAPFGEGYCWACVDEFDWPKDAAYTVLPGRSRESA